MQQITRVLNVLGLLVWLPFACIAGLVIFSGGLMAGNTVPSQLATASDLLGFFGPLAYFSICFLTTFARRRSYSLLAWGATAHLIGAAVGHFYPNAVCILLFLAFGLSWFGMYWKLPNTFRGPHFSL